jgi:hypothetical protein
MLGSDNVREAHLGQLDGHSERSGVRYARPSTFGLRVTRNAALADQMHPPDYKAPKNL